MFTHLSGILRFILLYFWRQFDLSNSIYVCVIVKCVRVYIPYVPYSSDITFAEILIEKRCISNGYSTVTKQV